MQKLKAITDSLESIPEQFHDLYVEQDGRFVLQVEGALPGTAKAEELAETKRKLHEFRESNVALLKGVAELAGIEEARDLTPLKTLLARFEGMDPEEYADLKRRAAELESKGVKGAKDISAAIQEHLDAFKKTTVLPLQLELKKEQEARAEATKRAERAHLRETIGAELSKAKAKRSAIDFLIERAPFYVEGDQITPRDGVFSARTGDPITLSEWVGQAQQEYDFAFESDAGGNSGGSDEHGAAAVKRLTNPTPQQLGDPKIARAIREGKLQVVNQ